MASLHRDRLFTSAYPAAGASDADLQFLAAAVAARLTDQEAASIAASQSNPFPRSDPLHATWRPHDPRAWKLPARPLPRAYLDFLKWSDGGSFFSGDRGFDPIFATREVRGILLSYHLPQYMPGAVPFAFDGDGRFYLFAMRDPPMRAEYPVLIFSAGNLRYGEALAVAPSFTEALEGTTVPE